jgi:hypothetical protein
LEINFFAEKCSFVRQKITAMFEVTIRTDNQAALEQVLEFLKGLDLKIVKPLKAANAKKNDTEKVEISIGGASPQPNEGKVRQIEGGMDVDITDVKPGFGCLKGMIHLAPDWDEPLEDFKEYMY